MSEKITRRRFLQAGAAVLAAAALTACGGGGGSSVVVNPTPEEKPIQLGDIEIKVTAIHSGSSGTNEKMVWEMGPIFEITNVGKETATLKASEFAAKVNGTPVSYVRGISMAEELLDENGERKIEAGKSVTGELAYTMENQKIEMLEITITHAKKKTTYTYRKDNFLGEFSPVTDA